VKKGMRQPVSKREEVALSVVPWHSQDYAGDDGQDCGDKREKGGKSGRKKGRKKDFAPRIALRLRDSVKKERRKRAEGAQWRKGRGNDR